MKLHAITLTLRIPGWMNVILMLVFIAQLVLFGLATLSVLPPAGAVTTAFGMGFMLFVTGLWLCDVTHEDNTKPEVK
jgi:hypothetical protein